MPRQARSEATRRRIIGAAVELIDETGYAPITLGDIIERSQLTKGALYYHFDSKEAVATAIIVEGGAALLATFDSTAGSSSPALEKVIHGLFQVVDQVEADATTRTAAQLLRMFGGHNDATRAVYTGWLTQMTEEMRRAQAEGDLRAELDPASAAELVVSAMIGTEVLSDVDHDLERRLVRLWQVLLPALVADESLGYFREFLAREGLPPTRPRD